MYFRGSEARQKVKKDDKERGGENPPSRHLWVGNLPHGTTEHIISDRFATFGVLESVAFQPGRSYAFVNFKREEDAFVAIHSLQGRPMDGNPLRIEFAKAEKPLVSRSQDHLHQEETYFTSRTFSSLQTDNRHRYECIDSPDCSKARKGDNRADPSNVLYLRFPANFNVDEVTLRKAFLPFGEVEKTTVFQGRRYAFIQFRSILSACRAKETLQGKLFGNSQVKICFAKSDPFSSNSVGMSSCPSLFPSSVYNFQSGSPNREFHDRNYESKTRLRDSEDPYQVSDRGSLYGDRRYNGHERKWPSEGSSEHELQQNTYVNLSSSIDRVSLFPNAAAVYTSRAPFYAEQWEKGGRTYHESKKLKASSFAAERDLPEYRLSDADQERLATARVIMDLSSSVDKSSVYCAPPGNKHVDVDSLSTAVIHAERGRSSTIEDWEWEGIVAKGGNPIFQARCFPVGKAMDMMLPAVLDCTARTSLDMLAKHYYQASSAWIVFFVPRSDADMRCYSEFMHYLEEKRRAAVSKLDEMTTLFLVPPSEFSETVLKVPGKLSISGVVLRLGYPGSTQLPVHQSNESQNADRLAYLGDKLYTKPLEFMNLPNVLTRDPSNPSARAVRETSETKHLPSRHFGSKRLPTTPIGSIHQGIDGHLLMTQETDTEEVAVSHAAGFSKSLQIDAKPYLTLSNLPPEQPGQLALPHISNNPLARSISPPGFSGYRLGQTEKMQPQQIQNELPTLHNTIENWHHTAASSMPQVQLNGNFEDAGEDPQNRLQATLQLAAALLHEIQQGNGDRNFS